MLSGKWQSRVWHVLATLVVLAGAAMPAMAQHESGMQLKAGREFAVSSYVHRPLPDRSDILPQSAVYVRDLARQVKAHGVTVNIDQYTPPIYIVAPNAPTTRVKAARTYEPGWSFAPLQQQWTDVPQPADFRPSAGTDKDAIVYQPATGRYWEFWGLEPTGRTTVNSAGVQMPEWQAAWGGRIDSLSQNGGYFKKTQQGHTFGVAATSLALLGGMMTIEEQRRGEISHALHIALPETKAGVWTYPAQRTDGNQSRTDAIPQGTLFRLPADLDLRTLSMHPYALMIARAVQKHGMLVRDTAGVVAFYAENPMPRMQGQPQEAHPYFGTGGILQCPSGRAEPACYPDANNRLAGFPWDRLLAVRIEQQ
ncbi:MAG: hypothetical protein ACRCWF_11745 [Beijerinckiaceae bacterium]